MTLKTFIVQHRITADAQWADANPNMHDMPAGSSHWRVTLKHGRRRMTIPFSQGPAHTQEPTAEDVLDCLASDASFDGYSFEDFCNDLGYDTDSRKAERTFNATQRQTAKVKQFMGEHYDAFTRAER